MTKIIKGVRVSGKALRAMANEDSKRVFVKVCTGDPEKILYCPIDMEDIGATFQDYIFTITTPMLEDIIYVKVAPNKQP